MYLWSVRFNAVNNMPSPAGLSLPGSACWSSSDITTKTFIPLFFILLCGQKPLTVLMWRQSSAFCTVCRF